MIFAHTFQSNLFSGNSHGQTAALELGGGTLGREGLGVLLGRSTGNTVEEAEVDGRVQELLDVVAADIFGVDDGGADNLDRGFAGTMLASHFSIQLLDSVRQGGAAEFLVHVVSSGTRVVTEPDAVVFDMVGVLLKNLNGKTDEFAAAGRTGLKKLPPTPTPTP